MQQNSKFEIWPLDHLIILSFNVSIESNSMDPDGTAPYTIWTQTILLLWEQSDLGPYCLYLEQSDHDPHRLLKRLSKTF